MVLIAFCSSQQAPQVCIGKDSGETVKIAVLSTGLLYVLSSCQLLGKVSIIPSGGILVAALHSISLIDPARDEQVDKALNWVVDHQEENGLWKTSYVEGKSIYGARARETSQWVSLAICRVFRRVCCPGTILSQE